MFKPEQSHVSYYHLVVNFSWSVYFCSAMLMFYEDLSRFFFLEQSCIHLLCRLWAVFICDILNIISCVPSSLLIVLYPPAAVITVEVWITMPRSVACPPSQRNATTARASRTWWLSVPTRRWRLPQALRTNMRLPRPSAQGPGPTSAPQRRRSALARLLWRAPPPPPRSPTHVAPGPRGGGNPENSP